MSIRNSCLVALTALSLAGCGQKPTAGNDAGLSANEANAALDNAMNATEEVANISADYAGTLVPPAPGEPGGLPDDREPLNESAARTPTNVEASGATIEQWGFALGEERYHDAYRLWRDNGRQSGMSEQQFASSYHRYSEIRVLIGRPQVSGSDTVRVPVQMYGRQREGGKPFNLYGTMTLVRNPAGQKGEADQPAWLIAASELKPLGTVKIQPESADSGAGEIPVAFRGNWSGSKASCTKAGDDLRLAVSANSLTFYESVGEVTSVKQVAPNQVKLSADYSGEGNTWSENSTLMLADGGNALTIGKMKRVRCSV